MVNGEVSRHGGPGRYILGDHGAQRDPCAVPNADTVGDGGIDADPDVFTDPDISGNFAPAARNVFRPIWLLWPTYTITSLFTPSAKRVISPGNTPRAMAQFPHSST